MENLEEANLVEPTHSYWAAPSIVVEKKDGTFRLVVDYRALNKQIEKTSTPLPRINDVIDSLDGNIYFSNIDLTSGYFQMALEEESQNLTAFITPTGLYKWKRLPMGLTSAPGAFQNLMELILAGVSYEVALIYLDDIIIFRKSFEEHLSRLELLLCRIKEASLKIKGSKCRFFQKRINFLGHIISKDGVKVDPDKVSAEANMKTASNLKELRAILGLVGFYRRFIADFGKIAGKNIPHADCLSRVPVVEDPSLVEEKTQILIEQPTENSWSDVFGDQTDDLRQHQQNSRETKEVFCWVEQKKRPEKRQMVEASKTTWKLWTDFQNLHISKGLLRQQSLLEENYRVQQMIVHRSYMDVILPVLHDSMGHQGMQKTLGRVQERFYWVGMKRDI